MRESAVGSSTHVEIPDNRLVARGALEPKLRAQLEQAARLAVHRLICTLAVVELAAVQNLEGHRRWPLRVGNRKSELVFQSPRSIFCTGFYSRKVAVLKGTERAHGTGC